MDIEALDPELTRLRTMLSEAPEDLVDYLRAITHFTLLEVPDCVAVSITVIDAGEPYTVSASSPAARVVDGAQYLAADGPCLATAEDGSVTDVPDVLDERRWHTFALAAAAKGIRSSLSLPLLFDGETIGALNLYGSTPGAFDDRAHLLAEIVSGHAELAVRNADLSMQSARLGMMTDARSDSAGPLDQAIGVLADMQQIDARSARRKLHRAAERAGVDVATLAAALVEIATT